MTSDDSTGKPRRIHLRWWHWLVIFLFASPLLLWLTIILLNPHAGPNNIRISRETTYITEPLDEEGYVDYAAALDARLSDGVTPENNAAVLLWQAIGPAEIPVQHRAEFFSRLGIDPLPDDGVYLTSPMEYKVEHPEFFGQESEPSDEPRTFPDDEEIAALVQQLDGAMRDEDWESFSKLLATYLSTTSYDGTSVLHRQYDFTIQYPWRTQDFPEIAAWLEEMQGPLDLVAAASRREKFYEPTVNDDQWLVMNTSSGLTAMRLVANALIARAMMRLSEGEIEGAWQDAMCVHRLARLECQGGTLINTLIAMAHETMAHQADAMIISSSSISPDVLANMRRDLRELPELPPIADAIDLGERFTYLDAVHRIARGNLSPEILDNPDQISAMPGFFGNQLVDWNVVLSNGVRAYDGVVQAAQMPTFSQQRAAADRVEQRLMNDIDRAQSWKALLAGVVSGRQRGESISLMLQGMMLPATVACVNVEYRCRVNRGLVETALALQAYRQVEGELPESLNELIPDFLDALPQDVFSGQPLGYVRGNSGYILYSVGKDQVDNGGSFDRKNSAWSAGQDGDDQVLEVPPRFKSD